MYALFAQDLLRFKPRYLVSRFASVPYAKRKARSLAGRDLDWYADERVPGWAYDVRYDVFGRTCDVTYTIIKEETDD